MRTPWFLGKNSDSDLVFFITSPDYVPDHLSVPLIEEPSNRWRLAVSRTVQVWLD